MNILLICKFNRFRSKIAEAFFKKHTNHNVKSAGIIKGPPIDNEFIQCAKKFGLELEKSFHTLHWNVLEWQDIIIIVANNVPKELFEDVWLVKKIRVWKIPDTIGKENKIKVIKMIEERVKGFTELSDK